MKELLLTAAAVVVAFTLSAQSGALKTIGNAAKNKVEQQDFNSTRSNKEKLNEDRRRSAPAPGASAPAPPADTTTTPAPDTLAPAIGKEAHSDTYTFGRKLTYQTEQLNNPKVEKRSVTYYYGDGAIMTEVPDKQMNVVMDFANESVITLDEKNRNATVMPSRWSEKMMNREPKEEAKVTKTGNTKQILGYNCEEYLIEGKTKSVCWITHDVQIDYAKMAALMARTNPAAGNPEMNGLTVEVTSYTKKGEAETHMILTEYKEETVTKALSNYKVTEL